SDGDLLIAWALMRAGKKWEDANYTAKAKSIAEALTKQAVITDPTYGALLLPAVKGFSSAEQPDGPVVNLSYWIFPAIADLGALDSEFPAQALLGTGTKLLKTARFGSSQMPSDWISLKGE